MIPAADGPGIKYTVTLAGDSAKTFTMEEVYLQAKDGKDDVKTYKGDVETIKKDVKGKAVTAYKLAMDKDNALYLLVKDDATLSVVNDQLEEAASGNNYKTVKQSIKRLEEKTAALENAAEGGFNKKEILEMQRDVEKLERSLGGIKNMKGLPDAIFVIDTGYQKGTLVEAEKLGIPVIAVVDTNNSPDGVKYVIPGNDDSAKAIRLYCRGIADAVLEGKNQALQETVAAAQEAAAE